LKWIRLVVLVAAGVVMTLGCVRGLAAPTVAVEAQTSTAKPMSVKAGLMSSAITVLWHDISVYRASGSRRLAGPT
jgi:hypothetical protein